MRKVAFANDEYYHVYNRGVDKREVFLDNEDFVRFLTCLREFNRIDPIGSLYEKSFKDKHLATYLGTKSPIGDLVPAIPVVEIIAYCLNPNHFHLILKQLQENGISKFMLKLSTGYTTYFNKKYKRNGSLFQGPFKAIHIDSNEYLLYLSAYVNRNYFIHGYNDNLGTKSPNKSDDDWKFCSVLDYLGKRNGTLCNNSFILNQFMQKGNSTPLENYREFLNANAQYFKDKKELEKYCLE